MEEDQELERKAMEELLKEGPMGWMKCPLAGTNKRFLINTIKNTLPSHKEPEHEQKEGNKEPVKSQDQKEVNPKQHRSHPYKHSLHAGGSVGSSPPRKGGARDKCVYRSSRL
uniref:Protein POLR1D n=1 Tax=Sciurus vulgaris TaxID=55149 RepID=A0A8D2CPC1_SCIVU